jgi:dienelactone hydrolase
MTPNISRCNGIAALLACALLSLAAASCSTADTAIRRADSLPPAMPWDLEALSVAPGFSWVDEDAPVRSLRYAGLPYAGHDTEVFAYYASPATLAGKPDPDTKYPAVVLVHGGGGTAFPHWAKLWAERGYAAIAMDLAGCGADRVPLSNGGPGQDDSTKFGQIDAAVTEQWSYHAVANVLLAHSLLRSFPEVDAERTAVTGISWGGYLTCIVAGLDNRFKAAVPIYGCGYLQEGSAWLDQFAAMTPAQKDKWLTLWEPSNYVGSAQMPVFFVNGTNDFAYWLESYAKTYSLVQSERNFRITVNMPHGHEVGWEPKEIGLFIDEQLIGGTPLPRLTEPRVTGGEARVSVQSETPLTSAELHYTTDTLPNPDRTWQTVPATMADQAITAPAPPAHARIWFFTATDERGAVVSTELIIANP